MLNRAPVVALTRELRTKALESRDELVTAHLEIVAPIARSLHRRFPPSILLDDLIQIGHLALITAAERYRPREHACTPFPAYARQRVRGAMLDSVRRRHWRNATMQPADEIAEQTAADNLIETEIDRGRLRRRVFCAVDALPAEARRVIAGRYSEECDLKTIARESGLSYTRAKQLHAEALAMLRERLL